MPSAASSLDFYRQPNSGSVFIFVASSINEPWRLEQLDNLGHRLLRHVEHVPDVRLGSCVS
jgi:hypothetical protein